jgi:prophage tail gpP-like protein
MNSSNIELLINDEAFTGWERVSMSFGVEALVDTFTVDVYDPKNTLSKKFKAGLKAEIYIANKPTGQRIRVLSGFIVGRNRSSGGGGTRLTLTGASRLVDLVECSAIRKSQTWANAVFSSIVQDIALPFLIDVDITQLKTNDVIKKFTLQSGEEAFSAIERLCRSQAVLPLSTFGGNLLLGYAAGDDDRAEVDLIHGYNIKNLSESESWKDRYSVYQGRAQFPGAGKAWSKELLQVSAESNDVGIDRYRPKLFVSESKADNKTLQTRVNWEAQVRSGRATTHTVEVSGWFQKNTKGIALKMWEPNERINLISEPWGLNLDRLITKVVLALDGGGERTSLTLRHPDTFKSDPLEKVDLT